jgi:hypothetical protein
VRLSENVFVFDFSDEIQRSNIGADKVEIFLMDGKGFVVHFHVAARSYVIAAMHCCSCRNVLRECGIRSIRYSLKNPTCALQSGSFAGVLKFDLQSYNTVLSDTGSGSRENIGPKLFSAVLRPVLTCQNRTTNCRAATTAKAAVK